MSSTNPSVQAASAVPAAVLEDENAPLDPVEKALMDLMGSLKSKEGSAWLSEQLEKAAGQPTIFELAAAGAAAGAGAGAASAEKPTAAATPAEGAAGEQAGAAESAETAHAAAGAGEEEKKQPAEAAAAATE